VRADRDRLGLDAGTALRATPTGLAVDLGPGARLDVAFTARRPWPRRSLGGLGGAHLVPGLQQYWHPHLLGASADGAAELGGRPERVDGLSAYAEKNWGRGFPGRWWWGQAQGWDSGDDACLAFAGGRLIPRSAHPAATAVVIRLGTSLTRFVAPLALVQARVGDGHWRIRARGVRSSVEVDADAGPLPPLRLPVPPLDGHLPGEVAQHQAGRVRVVLRRGRRTIWRGDTSVAGLELGELRGSARR
jgi:tocopherol cyclase